MTAKKAIAAQSALSVIGDDEEKIPTGGRDEIF
jgi:hypothetical protein